jgi:hypothetical protein
MRKLILAAALVLTATPAALAGETGFNPGTVVSNVYQNPAAGYGYGIGYGFGYPAPGDAYWQRGGERPALHERRGHRPFAKSENSRVN